MDDESEDGEACNGEEGEEEDIKEDDPCVIPPSRDAAPSGKIREKDQGPKEGEKKEDETKKEPTAGQTQVVAKAAKGGMEEKASPSAAAQQTDTPQESPPDLHTPDKTNEQKPSFLLAYVSFFYYTCCKHI